MFRKVIKNEAIPSGNFKTESSGPRLRGCWKLEIESWKLTEIKLAKNESRHRATQGGSGEKHTHTHTHTHTINM